MREWPICENCWLFYVKRDLEYAKETYSEMKRSLRKKRRKVACGRKEEKKPAEEKKKSSLRKKKRKEACGRGLCCIQNIWSLIH